MRIKVGFQNKHLPPLKNILLVFCSWYALSGCTAEDATLVSVDAVELSSSTATERFNHRYRRANHSADALEKLARRFIEEWVSEQTAYALSNRWEKTNSLSPQGGMAGQHLIGENPRLPPLIKSHILKSEGLSSAETQHASTQTAALESRLISDSQKSLTNDLPSGYIQLAYIQDFDAGRLLKMWKKIVNLKKPFFTPDELEQLDVGQKTFRYLIQPKEVIRPWGVPDESNTLKDYPMTFSDSETNEPVHIPASRTASGIFETPQSVFLVLPVTLPIKPYYPGPVDRPALEDYLLNNYAKDLPQTRKNQKAIDNWIDHVSTL